MKTPSLKTVGIIGGLGPETTAEFYLEVLFQCQQLHDIQRPPMIIWNVPLVLEIEQEMLTNATGAKRYLPFLIETAQSLEKAGADFLVMPCNTLHIFISQIRDAVDIPVLSIVEEIAAFLKQRDTKHVGLIATPQCVKDKLYDTELEKVGMDVALPDGLALQRIGVAINNIVRNRHRNVDREELQNIVKSFEEKEVDAVVLACTDLQLLIPQSEKFPIFDSMKIFADATVREILQVDPSPAN